MNDESKDEMIDDLKDEIETLQSVYTADELIIKSQDGQLHVVYTTKLEESTEIIVDFEIKNKCSISITNGKNIKKIIPNNILSKIEKILMDKYQEETDSMPIFQCISFCNDELLEDERFNISAELCKIKDIKPKFDQEAFLSELVQQYRQDFRKNGGGFLLKYAGEMKFRYGKITEDEKIDLTEDYISKDLNQLIRRNKCLWKSIPSMDKVKSILQKKYAANSFRIKFIASYKNVEIFLKNGGKSKSFSLVFHGTSSRNDSSIIENGLVVGGTKGVPVANGRVHGTGVYCSPSLDTAGCYARGSMFVCLIRTYAAKKSRTIYVIPDANDILPIYLSSVSSWY